MVESARRCHEELHRLEQAAAEELLHETDLLLHQHAVSNILSRIETVSQDLHRLYAEGLVEKETQDGAWEMIDYYRRLQKLKHGHKTLDSDSATDLCQWRMLATRYRPTPETLDVMFSGEEGCGRYFDLHECHEST